MFVTVAPSLCAALVVPLTALVIPVSVVPLVTLLGCVAVNVQLKNPSLELLKPDGIAILKTNVLVVSTVTVAYFESANHESPTLRVAI